MKYVIFDIDGTLTDTKNVDDRCFIQAFVDVFDLDITNFKWETLQDVTDWGITEEIVEQRLSRKPTQAEFQTLRAHFVTLLHTEYAYDAQQFVAVEGAKAFFDTMIQTPNIAVGIATGCWKASALIKLNAANISTTPVCFSNSDHHRSRTAITLDVITQLKIKTQQEPTQIVYFGDGIWDFKTCKILGIDFIGIDIQGDGVLKELGAKNVFRNFTDKQTILNTIL